MKIGDYRVNKADKQPDNQIPAAVEQDDETWVKPAVTSFAPVKAAEGISYTPTDGLTNLTP
jgi:hypothetical protein